MGFYLMTNMTNEIMTNKVISGLSDFSALKALFERFKIPFTVEKKRNTITVKVECTNVIDNSPIIGLVGNTADFVFDISNGEYMHTLLVSEDSLVKRLEQLEQKLTDLKRCVGLIKTMSE